MEAELNPDSFPQLLSLSSATKASPTALSREGPAALFSTCVAAGNHTKPGTDGKLSLTLAV